MMLPENINRKSKDDSEKYEENVTIHKQDHENQMLENQIEVTFHRVRGEDVDGRH
jgi:hypothetical protein